MSSLYEYEFNTEFEFEGEGELVHELLSVSNEYEFENFLGNVWNAAKRLYNSPQGQAVKKDFVAGAKSFGKKMLPSVGRNLGSYLGGSTGANIGGQLANAASNWLFNEVGEAEAVDYLRVVRKAAKYLNKALSEGAGGPPRTLVTQAINQAARPVLAQRRLQSPSGNMAPSSKNREDGSDKAINWYYRARSEIPSVPHQRGAGIADTLIADAAL
ncbi:hypothetical protein [Paraflavitalea speifideaquila]|uniref:hypothetical protein n=1 Tax=Paraflavitalea speifideaquila TaxID=3076558 RepID=UPI0028EA00E0|nr:hypothetical protein [Paraflavitalea speifideiaquila]